MHKITEKKSFFGNKMEVSDSIIATDQQGYISCIKILDDSHVFSASGDQTIKLSNFTTNSVVSNFDDHTGDVMCVSINQTKTLLLSGSCDLSSKLWDLKSTKCISTYKTAGDVDAVDFHPSGNIISIASEDHIIRLFDIRKSDQSFLEFKTNEIGNCLKFSKEGSHLFAGIGNSVHSFNLLTGMDEEIPFQQKISAMDIMGDGSSKNPFQLVATSWDTGTYFFGIANEKKNWKTEFQ
jgi:guanine nucleotide-binding protein G(I)/G(S)/G(T) subunit beta-1